MRSIELPPKLLPILLCLSAALALALTLIYRLRPDGFSAVTMIPALWWLVFVLPLAFVRRKKQLYYAGGCALAWLLFTLVHVEEPRTVLRGIVSPPSMKKSEEPGVLRIVSFNTGGGSVAPVEELRKLDPDIVFLQESPGEEEVARAARELFGEEGGFLRGLDCSILARGRLTDLRPTPGPVHSCHALLDTGSGQRIELVGLRLLPSSPRMDLWNPRCWSAQKRMRKAQMRLMREIVEPIRHAGPVIVGGDFNVPQGDRVFSLLKPKLRDTFAEQGRGLGNTIPAAAPVLRIDQIWVSSEFEIRQSFCRPSGISDHRPVVSDVRIQGREK